MSADRECQLRVPFVGASRERPMNCMNSARESRDIFRFGSLSLFQMLPVYTPRCLELEKKATTWETCLDTAAPNFCTSTAASCHPRSDSSRNWGSSPRHPRIQWFASQRKPVLCVKRKPTRRMCFSRDKTSMSLMQRTQCVYMCTPRIS